LRFTIADLKKANKEMMLPAVPNPWALTNKMEFYRAEKIGA
jgi:hypothetical protein